MTRRLTDQEQSTLEAIAERGRPALARRARLLLLWGRGLAPKEIASRIGLSVARVYHWLRAFRERRMAIFPAEALSVSRPAEGVREAGSAREPVAGAHCGASAAQEMTAVPEGMPTTGTERPEVTIEELCQRYDVDMAHAQHVAELAMTLFDVTARVHGLSRQRRWLLETAAVLHNVGFALFPGKHHTFGRDIILAHRLVELQEVEQSIVACTTALHRKRFKTKRLDKEPSLLALPEAVRGDALSMAALIRMADGLDYSQTQTTKLGEAEDVSQGIALPVLGPVWTRDAARAQQKADLWHHLFDVGLRFVAEGEPVVWDQLHEVEKPEFGLPKEELKAPGVLPEDLMSEAGRKVLRFHFQRMLDHEPGTRLGDDIEELHDMRVATRRMRAAFRVFGPYFEPDEIKPFLKGLRRTGRALGSVRDLDVFMHKAQAYLDEPLQEEQAGLEPLLASWQQQREAARGSMLAYLDGKRYQPFVRDFGQFLWTEGAGAVPVPYDQPQPHQVRHVVPALIYGRYEVVRGYETVVENASIETLHALRIDCKRLRYSLEFFREVLGAEVEDVIDEVVVIQDHLGNLHDADVACHLLIEFLNQWSEREGRERINIAGVTHYLVAKQNELRTLLDSFPEAWQHFNRPEMRRKLALAVSTL